MHTGALVVGVGVLFFEVLLLFAAPQVLSRFAFIPLPQEHRITLPRPKLQASGDGAYRDPALTRPAYALPSIPFGRRDLDDAVLVAAGDGRSFALRRAYAFFQRRLQYLVRIDMTIEADELVLRARQSIVPLSFPFAALCFVVGEHGDLLVAGAMAGGVVVGLVVSWLFVGGPRDRAIAQAFDMLEAEVRKTFPKPPATKKKRRAPADDAESA